MTVPLHWDDGHGKSCFVMGYAKVFESMFTGSMIGAGPATFAVWVYALTQARPPEGAFEMNTKLVAVQIGCDESEVEKAIEFLTSPDPKSRSKEMDGRRLVQEGAFQYRVVNFASYRKIRDEEERREQNRLAKQRQRDRERKKAQRDSQQSQHGQPGSAHAEASSEASSEANQSIDQSSASVIAEGEGAVPADARDPDRAARLAAIEETLSRARAARKEQ